MQGAWGDGILGTPGDDDELALRRRASAIQVAPRQRLTGLYRDLASRVVLEPALGVFWSSQAIAALCPIYPDTFHASADLTMQVKVMMKRTFRVFHRSVSRPGVRWSLGAVLLYTLTTLVMMYPVPFHLDSVIVGDGGGDAYQYAWSLWWVKQAVLDPDKDLVHLTLMNHPAGVEHSFMLTMIGVSLPALPFSLLFSPVVAYNLQILLSFVLSGLTMYWLCAELVGDRKAGLVGGFIFAFFLNKTGHVLGGHLPQVTVYWVPLYVLLLWRAVRRPGWGTAMAAALVLIPACLIHVMHLAYFVLPVSVAVLLVAWTEMKGTFLAWRRLGALTLVVGLAAVVVVPLLLPTVLDSLERDSYLQNVGTVLHSVDLLAFFTPSPYHPLLGSLGLVPSFAGRIFPDDGFSYEGLAYPGVLAVGLALWGLVRQGRKVWVWGVLALLAAVLSLGPLLKIGGELLLYQVDAHQSYVVLPYALLKKMPLMDVGRTPGRFNETAMFAVAILASYGAAALFSLLTQRPRLLASVLAFLLIGTGFEYVAVWPFPASTAEIPPAIRDIAGEPGDGALLHVLMKRRWINHRALYYQTVARRPVVGGKVHRAKPEALPWSRMLLGLAQPDPEDGDIVPRPNPAARKAWLRYFDVDYVIFHKLERWDDSLYRDFIESMLGPPKYEDPTLAAFPVPGDAPAPDSSRLYAFSRDGWDPPERDGDVWRRWMYDEGRLYLYSTREEIGSLRFAVDSDVESPVLEVYLGEGLLNSFVVGEHTTYTTRPFTLTQGMSDLHFRAPGGCPPALDDDTTCRTFVLDHVSFIPQADLRPGEVFDVSFGDQMRLRGWEVGGDTWHPGGVLTVRLLWEARVDLSDQYVVFVHLLSSDGTLVAQHDAPPAEPLLSSGTVPLGAIFSYPVMLELPDNLPTGDYRLLVGVYLWPSLERLPVLADVPGAEIGVVELKSVRIEQLRD
jgi:hypothetical protein